MNGFRMRMDSSPTQLKGNKSAKVFLPRSMKVLATAQGHGATVWKLRCALC